MQRESKFVFPCTGCLSIGRHAENCATQNIAEVWAEHKKFLAALNHVASWNEGPVVNGSFDEPGSAEIAREALKDNPIAL